MRPMGSGDGGWEKTAGWIAAIAIIVLMVKTGAGAGAFMLLFGTAFAIGAIVAVVALFGRTDVRMKGIAAISLVIIGISALLMLRGTMLLPGGGHTPALIPPGGIADRSAEHTS